MKVFSKQEIVKESIVSILGGLHMQDSGVNMKSKSGFSIIENAL